MSDTNYDFKIGIAPISWINDDMPELGDHFSLDRILSDMLAIGYTATELGRTFPQDIKELKSILNKYELTLASKFVGVVFSNLELRDSELHKFQEWVDFLQQMDCEHIIVCEMGKSMHWDTRNENLRVEPLSDQEWDSMITGLEIAGRIAKQRGMKLVYHPHGGTVVEQRKEVDRLMAMTDPSLVSLLFDTGHAFYGSDDPLDQLIRHYDRIQYIHYKDVRQNVLEEIRKEGHTFREGVLKGIFTVPGDGSLDFEPIIAELMKRGYKGWIIVEAEQNPVTAPPYQYAEAAKKYLDQTIHTLQLKMNS